MRNRFTQSVRALAQPRALEWATLVTIALPIPIFIVGWIRPWLALPALAVVLGGVYLAMRPDEADSSFESPREPARPARPWKSLGGVLMVAIALFVALYSGVGGYAKPQEHAYHRHNAFLQDLIEFPWPPAYADTGPNHEPGVLVFYLGNALAPALAGKLFGWVVANHVSFGLAALSLLLAMWWFVRIVGATPVYALVFVFFGGLDLLGHLAVTGWYQDGTQNLDFWARNYSIAHRSEMRGVYWMYASNMYLLYHAPQHVVCSWLAILVIFHDAIRLKSCRRTVFVWSCSLLWSAFSFVGMLPFVVLAILTTRGRGLFSACNTIAGTTVLLLTGLFIASNSGDYVQGWLWYFLSPLETWPILILVLALEFGIYALVVPLRSAGRNANLAWFWLALFCLLASPLYRLGQYNDLTTKAVIPAFVVFQLFLAMAIAHARSESERRASRVLVVLLAVGALTAVSSITEHVAKDFDFQPPPLREVAHVDEIEPRKLAAQLFGNGDNFFWRVLAREPVFQPPDRRRGRRPFTGTRNFPKVRRE